mmetsp:Transcript_6444/g.20282  ORF Transcript_6444/g.20282 Transcript_6444/m.20282 type:complete len:335 (-) Transcript_6444:518-1522(-)
MREPHAAAVREAVDRRDDGLARFDEELVAAVRRELADFVRHVGVDRLERALRVDQEETDAPLAPQRLRRRRRQQMEALGADALERGAHLVRSGALLDDRPPEPVQAVEARARAQQPDEVRRGVDLDADVRRAVREVNRIENRRRKGRHRVGVRVRVRYEFEAARHQIIPYVALPERRDLMSTLAAHAVDDVLRAVQVLLDQRLVVRRAERVRFTEDRVDGSARVVVGPAARHAVAAGRRGRFDDDVNVGRRPRLREPRLDRFPRGRTTLPRRAHARCAWTAWVFQTVRAHRLERGPLASSPLRRRGRVTANARRPRPHGLDQTVGELGARGRSW